jgi:hypothetical protein
MPKYEEYFKTASLKPLFGAESNAYPEGYHKGDHLGLTDFEPTLIGFNIWENVMIFGVQGQMVWGGYTLPIASINASRLAAIQAIAASLGVSPAAIASVLAYDAPAATFTPTIAMVLAASILTPDLTQALGPFSAPSASESYELLSAVGGAIQDLHSGSQTDETAAANNPTPNDMHLMVSATTPPAVGDAYDIGFASIFPGLRLKQDTPGVGIWTITWKYWNGAWTPLSGVTDETTGFLPTTGGLWGNNDYRVYWTVPGDWALHTIKGYNLYWVRAEVTSYTSMTTEPLGTQCWIQTAAGS